MKIKIGKLHILFTWGDPTDTFRKEYDKRLKQLEVIKKIRDEVQKRIDEENEPDYFKEIKDWLRQGNMLEAVKVYFKANPDDGLRDARIAVENIKSKMEINAKNE